MEVKEIEQSLVALIDEQKKFIARADTEFKTNGTMHTETKTALDAIIAQRDKMQTQLDAYDAQMKKAHHGEDIPMVKSIGQLLTEDENYIARQKAGFTGRAPLAFGWESSAFPVSARKSNITGGGLGSGTSGIMMPQFFGGPLVLAKQELRLRNIMPSTPLTTGTGYYYVRQTTRTTGASPQTFEASPKQESTYGWDTISDTVKTIAHFTNVSRQALDDIPWLRNQIDTELMYGLLLVEEGEILAGSGTNAHLNGLLTQATAYLSATYNVAGDTNIDVLRHAKLQARLAGLATFAPSAYVLHPTDMARIELTKVAQSGANTGLYILGDPKSGPTIKMIWGLPVVESDSIAAGTFLVGAFDTAAELVDRMAASVDISFEHASNFTANLATLLCEERIGLAVKRPTAFIKGTLPSALV